MGPTFFKCFLFDLLTRPTCLLHFHGHRKSSNLKMTTTTMTTMMPEARPLLYRTDQTGRFRVTMLAVSVESILTTAHCSSDARWSTSAMNYDQPAASRASSGWLQRLTQRRRRRLYLAPASIDHLPHQLTPPASRIRIICPSPLNTRRKAPTKLTTETKLCTTKVL